MRYKKEAQPCGVASLFVSICVGCVSEIFGPEVVAVEGGKAIVVVELVEDEELAARAKSHINLLMEVAHNDIVNIGVRGREVLCPLHLKGVRVGGVCLVIVVMAIGVGLRIVL